MKAIGQDTYGYAEVLRFEEVEPPEIGSDEVLVRVRAAGVDRGVWHLMTGLPYLVRILGFGFRGPKQRTPGEDVAGLVEAIGKDVTRFQAGDEVFGFAKGSFAELARAPERTLAKKPAQLGFEEAAAVPVSALTALQGLRDHGRLSSGQHVLILGASGGVGSFAVQIAKAHGAEVTGVCGASKLDLVRELGADHALDYAADDFALQPGAYDLVFDIGGNRSLRTLRRALSPRGTLVIVGGEGGDRWTGGVHRQLRAVLWSLFLRPRMSTFVAQPNPQDVQELKELLETGKLRAAVDRSFPLREAADAIRYLESGSVRSLS